MTDKDKREEQDAPALQIISLFGGIRPMAHKLDVPVSTVQGWKERSAIPANRHGEILAAAARHQVELPLELLKRSDPGAEGGQEAAEEAGTAGEAEAAVQETAEGAGLSGEAHREETAPEDVTAEGAAAERAPVEEAQAEEGETEEGARQAPPAAMAPAAAATARSRGSGALIGGIVLGALILAAGAGGAVVTRDIWLPYFGASSASSAQTPAPAIDISGLESRLASLESAGVTRISSLEASMQKLSEAVAAASEGSGADERTLTGLEAEIANLKERLSGLETSAQAGPAVTPEEISSLTGAQQNLASRLSGIEAEVGEVAGLKQEVGQLSAKLADIRRSANADGAMLLAGLQLRDAVKGSRPFEAPLKALEMLAAGDPELTAIIAPLKPYAASGVETLEELRADFPPVAAEVVAVERGADAGDGWLSGAVRRISEVVTVRPVGLVEGDEPGSAVARAEFYLEAGDLAAALAELDGLSGAAAEPAAEWRAKAEARLAVDKALAQVADLVARRLANLGE